MRIDVEKIDRYIKRFSRRSKKAPSDFLENELRRLTNWYAVFSRAQGLEADTHFDTHFFSSRVQDLEREYQCYFSRDKFIKKLEPSSSWKFTYAGCNAQVEFFLLENGLEAALEKIYSWPKTIEKNELSDPLRRYFIGIGYLYPSDEDTLAVHPNLLYGQLGIQTNFRTADSSFLTRDLIRCPYHEARYDRAENLSDQELWNYWKDLLALSMAGSPQYTYYGPKHLRGEERLTEELHEHLMAGRRFVPSRYIGSKPKMDMFGWYFPKT